MGWWLGEARALNRRAGLIIVATGAAPDFTGLRNPASETLQGLLVPDTPHSHWANPPPSMLELIYETMSDGVAVFDLSGRVVFCNPAMCLLAGRSVQQVVGRTAKEAWGGKSDELSHSPSMTTVDEQIIRPDGSQKLATVKSFGLTSSPPLQVHIYRDVTKVREARRALEDSYKVFHAFMANNPAATTIKDLQGRYVYVNPTAEQLFDRPLDEWLGKSDAEIWPADVAELIHRNDGAVRRTGEILQFEESLPVGDSRRHFLTSRFVLAESHDKNLLASTSLDVTALIHREEGAVQREQVMEVLLDVMAALSASSTQDLRKILVLLGAVIDTSCATIALRRSRGSIEILQHHWSGNLDSTTKSQPRWELPESELPLLLAKMATGNRFVVEDLTSLKDAEAREISLLHGEETRAVMAVPIVSEGLQLRGFLAVGHREAPHEWRDIEIRALEIVSRMLRTRLPVP